MSIPAKFIVAAQRLACAALVVGIAATLARSAWFFAVGPQPPALAAIVRPTEAMAEISVEEVAAANLFGDPSLAPAREAEVAAEDTPDTRLNLALAAIYEGAYADDSIAVIAAGEQAPRAYRVGDAIPGKAEIVEIHRRQVVIRRNGAREKLRFDGDSSGLVASQGESGFVANRERAPSPAAAVDPTPPDRLAPLPQRLETPAPGGESAANYRESLRSDAERTLAEAGLQPVSSSAPRGYRLGALANAPQLAHTGLQSGDVILSVNGRPVGDARRDRLEIDDVISAGSARIEVQRGERRFFVTAALR